MMSRCQQFESLNFKIELLFLKYNQSNLKSQAGNIETIKHFQTVYTGHVAELHIIGHNGVLTIFLFDLSNNEFCCQKLLKTI